MRRPISLKFLREEAPSFFGTRIMKVAPRCFGRQPLRWNSLMKAMTSCLTISQKILKKAMGCHPGLGYVITKVQTATLISSSEKGLSRCEAPKKDMDLNGRPAIGIFPKDWKSINLQNNQEWTRFFIRIGRGDGMKEFRIFITFLDPPFSGSLSPLDLKRYCFWRSWWRRKPSLEIKPGCSQRSIWLMPLSKDARASGTEPKHEFLQHFSWPFKNFNF